MTDQTTQIDEGSSPFTSAAAPGAMPRRDVMIIAVLLVSTFVVILNETIMSIALPVLAEDLRVDYSQGQWLTSGFLLTMAVVIPVTGFLIRRIRTRVLFMLAMTLFSAGTLLAALAPSFEVLLAARVVQASGTAIMMPLLMTTVMKLVPGERRGAVMGNIGTVIAVAPAIGPTISGFVLHSLGWRALYWLVLPIALAALAFGIRSMIDVGEPERVRVDVVSVLLSGIGFGALVYGLSAFGHEGGGAGGVPAWVPIVGGAAVLTVFVVRQLQLQRTDDALLDLRTFTSGGFTIAAVLMVLMMTVLFGAIILLPIYMQEIMGLDVQTSGLVLLPGGLVMGLLGPVVGRLYDRVGARRLLAPGVVVTSLALWSTTLFTAQTGIALLLAFHITLSVGLAFVFTPLFTSGLGAVQPRFYSYGSAIFGTTQQLAGAAGVALLVSVMSARAGSLAAAGAAPVEATVGGIHTAFLVAAVLSLVAIVGAFFVRTPQGAPAH
ncbi:MFS transporter, DHA2 family, lincomycin resistance protein [Pseudonocardia thermophila]|uniref:MFS transporter, DHA2 family, lincomycin resistance protein n=1 Tax=Pseudonocardia thermophila TaxID=1848 RepID=A0A1M6NGL8_PSETH|nr:MDR family MFS transporter [Pseudonocardia thermophila]SHJ94802.1 MFS transporter, DHA2 family, lincomycin resistance protein [Pseudonocardia thermophila]